MNDAAKGHRDPALNVALWTMETKVKLSLTKSTPANRWHKLAAWRPRRRWRMLCLCCARQSVCCRYRPPSCCAQSPTLLAARARISSLPTPGWNAFRCSLGGKAGDDACEVGLLCSTPAAMASAVGGGETSGYPGPDTAWGAIAIVRLITEVASRFSIVVSEGAAAQAVPVVGRLAAR